VISLELTNIDEAKRLFGSDATDRALKSTLNKLAAQGKTAVSKEIRKTYNIKARDLNNAMKARRVKAGSHESYIIASGPRFSLIYFDAQETVIRGNDAILTKRARGKNGSGGLFSVKTRKGKRQRGVTVKVRHDSGRKRVLGQKGFGAFLAQGNRGKIGGGNARPLFNRSEEKQGRGNFQIFMRQDRERLPIDRLTGPAVAQMLGQKASVVQDFINKESSRIFSHELDFFAGQVIGRV
jgi:hypothetical protein